VWDNPVYNLTGPMFSVLARVHGTTGQLLERVRYRPYGEARHQWGHDVDGDGDADSADEDVITVDAWMTSIGDVGYDVDADLDRDGDVDAADEAAWSGEGSQAALAEGALSDTDAVVGWSGYLGDVQIGMWHVRHRAFGVSTGRWVQSDPLGYLAGSNEYLYAHSDPLTNNDPSGLIPPCDPCDMWLRDNSDTSWTEDLPDCPCALPLSGGSPVYGPGGLDDDVWQEPGSPGLHDGARWCTRSRADATPTASSQQCCYDQSGSLITHGAGTGTPDKHAPIGIGGTLLHFIEDVVPFGHCSLEDYHTARPPNNGNDCTVNP